MGGHSSSITKLASHQPSCTKLQMLPAYTPLLLRRLAVLCKLSGQSLLVDLSLCPVHSDCLKKALMPLSSLFCSILLPPHFRSSSSPTPPLFLALPAPLCTLYINSSQCLVQKCLGRPLT